MRILSFAAAVALFACNALAAGPAWHIEKLPDNAPLFQQSGCMGSFSPKGHGADVVFLDDGVDVKAKANIKLGGKIFALDLVSTKASGKQGADSAGLGAHFDRVFKDKAGAVTVVESITVTAEHPEADSTEEKGTLTVTYQGTTQKVEIEGGTAC
ncbi:MAG: hypothetical protein ISS15_07865 [Alphaproteobacteria bacterium]|nr:hypothetical protein [Alphaproteobacteria bacterium]MBL6936787.1 hypothetical protein [Alphaproteobacteria bacterium]MBL7097556.1 hypothetical protein [Alphaproteobacteria bacterium]